MLEKTRDVTHLITWSIGLYGNKLALTRQTNGSSWCTSKTHHFPGIAAKRSGKSSKKKIQRIETLVVDLCSCSTTCNSSNQDSIPQDSGFPAFWDRDFAYRLLSAFGALHTQQGSCIKCITLAFDGSFWPSHEATRGRFLGFRTRASVGGFPCFVHSISPYSKNGIAVW